MMCPEVLHGLATSLKQAGMIPGNDYNIVTFSIDPDEWAPANHSNDGCSGTFSITSNPSQSTRILDLQCPAGRTESQDKASPTTRRRAAPHLAQRAISSYVRLFTASHTYIPMIPIDSRLTAAIATRTYGSIL